VSFVFSTEARAARKRPYAVPVEVPTTNSRGKTAAGTAKKRRVDTEVAQQ
jgi:hypothetical protein